MRGKGRARIVLFATVGIGACAGGLTACAKAGDLDDVNFNLGADAGGVTNESGEASRAAAGDDAKTEPDEAATETATDDGTSDGAADGAGSGGDDGDVRAGSGDGGAGAASDASEGAGGDAQGEDFDAGGYYEYPPDATLYDATALSGGAADGGADAGSADGAGVDATLGVGGAGVDAGLDAAPDGTLGAASDGAADAACGGCAGGFSCGTSGYCVSSTGVPAFDHVVLIVMEEQSLSAIQGSASAPYINSLIAGYALATGYTAPDHPSLPNYLELTSGGTQGVPCDCAPSGTPTCALTTSVCNVLLSNCNCPQSVTHLGDELDTAGLQWREYAEGMGTPCNVAGTDAGADFAASHVPFLYYDDVFTQAGRCVERVRDYGDFAADLAGGVYAFSMISPNTCHDMQTLCTGNQVLQGDDWLSINVPPILATAGFGAGGRDALFLVWEEAGTDVGTPPVPLVVVSPLARATTTSAAYTHASLLATIEDGLGVPRLGNSAGVAPVADVWK
jgi:hypothetical protein